MRHPSLFFHMKKTPLWLIVLTLAVFAVGFWGYHAASKWDFAEEGPKSQNQVSLPSETIPSSNSLPEKNNTTSPFVPAEKRRVIGASPLPESRPPAAPSEEMLKRFTKDTQKRIALNLSGGAFFQALPGPKQKEVLDALSKAEMARMNLMHEGMVNRQPPSAQQMDKIRNESDEAVRAIIGDAAFSDYQTYMSNQPHRTVVKMMNDGLDEPLNEQASEAVIQILAEEARTLGATAGSTTDPESARAGMKGMADRAIERASSVLSPDQVQAMRGSFDKLLSREKPPR